MEKSLGQERKSTRASGILPTTETPDSSIPTREHAALWMELQSIVESVPNRSDHDTASIYANPTMITRDLTNSTGWKNLSIPNSKSKTALTDEKRDRDVSYDQESIRSSKRSISAASIIESDIVYPSTLRVLLVTVSLAIATFLVGLDRTIVATAT